MDDLLLASVLFLRSDRSPVSDLIVSTKCRAFFLCHLLKKPPTEQVNPMENGVHPKAVKVLTLVWHVGMTMSPRIS